MTTKRPRKIRRDENIGGGFFIFARCPQSGRVHPSPFPFEHPHKDAALKEANRLAHLHPGQVFEVFGSLGAAFVEKTELAA